MFNRILSVCFLLLCLCLAPIAQGQTVSASGNTSSMQLGRLNTEILTLQQQLNAANSDLGKVKACLAQSKFYNPQDPKADGNGCTGEQDPQVNSLVANGLCTSDGNVIDCKAMQGADIKVFSVTQIASNHTTATATCPSGTLRVGCAGDRDYASNCTEGTCGIASITPVGVNACQITAHGGSIVPAAVALCFSLHGGSDIVQGSAPPKSCTLPWGGTLASGQGVTAYQAASVPAGNTCVSQTRSCSNGNLSGSYGYASCSVSKPTSCRITYDGAVHTVANGTSITRYAKSDGYALGADFCQCGGAVEARADCGPQTATCSSGTVVGKNPMTGTYSNCTIHCVNIKPGSNIHCR